MYAEPRTRRTLKPRDTLQLWTLRNTYTPRFKASPSARGRGRARAVVVRAQASPAAEAPPSDLYEVGDPRPEPKP